MHSKKFLRKFLVTSLAAGSLIFTPEIYGLPTNTAIVHAEIKEYVGVGESIVSDRETLEIGKQGAKLQAIRNAQKQAGVFIGSYSVVKNNELNTDEVVALTAGVVKVSDNVKYEPIQVEQWIKYRATVTVTIDTDDLNRQVEAWSNRSSRDRSNIVEQNKDLQNLVDQQAKRIKELEQTIAASKDKEKVRAEISRIENETQIIEKTSEGNLAYYNGDYSTAAEKYSDVLKLKEFDFEGKATVPLIASSPSQRTMIARRAALADAYRNLAEYLGNYFESRKSGILYADEQFKKIVMESIKRSKITYENLNVDGTYSIGLRLRSKDVDKLKAYLER